MADDSKLPIAATRDHVDAVIVGAGLAGLLDDQRKKTAIDQALESATFGA